MVHYPYYTVSKRVCESFGEALLLATQRATEQNGPIDIIEHPDAYTRSYVVKTIEPKPQEG